MLSSDRDPRCWNLRFDDLCIYPSLRKDHEIVADRFIKFLLHSVGFTNLEISESTNRVGGWVIGSMCTAIGANMN
jgi:hypothetical protein